MGMIVDFRGLIKSLTVKLFFMKKGTTLWAILFLLSLVTIVFLYTSLQKEKKKWQFLNSQIPTCAIDSSYQVLFIDPTNKCDYIVIKKKNSKFGFFKNNPQANIISEGPIKRFLGTGFIDRATAIRYITNYNEKFNHSLANSSFIDFESAAIMKYLLDMKGENPNLNFLRVFLADYGDDYLIQANKQTAVLTVTSTIGGEYFPVLGEEAVNYGGLCPPPSRYEELRAISELLSSAIDLSNEPTRVRPPGGQLINRQP